MNISATNLTKLTLTPTDSNELKGIAVLMLLFHHLFYIDNGLFNELTINGNNVIHAIAHACKACVPLFVFLSGYGLMASMEKQEKFNIRHFFARRFTKLYMNFWLIWLLFVPIGVLLFDRTFNTVYTGNIPLDFCLDLLGILNVTGRYGFNPTWWFYSCIISLYILFPLMLMLCKKRYGVHIMLTASVVIAFCSLSFIQPVRYYLLPFTLGVIMRNGLIHNILPPPVTNITTELQKVC